MFTSLDIALKTIFSVDNKFVYTVACYFLIRHLSFENINLDFDCHLKQHSFHSFSKGS